MYYFLSLFLLLTAEISEPLENKKVLFVIAHRNFRDEEYKIPRRILENAGADIIVASSDTSEAKGMIELTLKPDVLLSEVNCKEFDAVVFIGGTGATEYWEHKTAHAIIDSMYNQNKIIAAICIASVILAKAGILEGKKATVHETPATVRIFKEQKVKYTGEPVTVVSTRDTNPDIITANSPLAAKRFGEEILRLLLKKKEK